jgi:Fic-DOC domain mobile mystery protein B
VVEAVALTLAEKHGQTPLDADEAAQLIPKHIAVQEALDEWEQANIQRAVEWLGRQRKPEVLTIAFCLALHKRMFDKTWRWAGKFRQSDKNIGCEWTQVPTRLQQLLDNTRYQLANKVLPIDEATARFHHQLVFIHPFANGNGRHARLMTDCLRRREGVAAFTWGRRANLVELGDVRHRYIDALRAADRGDIQPLITFVMS